MKNILQISLVIILFLNVFSNAINAQGVVKEGNTWKTRVFDNGDFFFRLYQIGGDTLINSTTYRKVEIHEDTMMGVWTTADYFMREEAGRVYQWHNGFEIQTLNFNLVEGDTVTGFLYEYYVTDVDTVEMINGDMRKRINIESTSFNCYAAPIIEGVGSTHYPPFWDSQCWDLVNELLACYYENNEQVFAANMEMCESTVATENVFLSKNKITVFPNPANEILNIDNLPINFYLKNIQIFDGMGRLVFEKQYNHKNLDRIKTLSIAGLNQGVFFVKVNYREGYQSLLFYK